jgi:glucose 1-dehydrogenase
MSVKNTSGSSDLKGKVVVVTGAASGIGEGIAKAFAAEGARTCLLDRNKEALNSVCDEIRVDGGETLGLVCDVSDATSVEKAADEIRSHYGLCNVLINNAGFIRPGGIADLSLEDWNEVLSVNLTGCFICAKTFIAQMREHGGGSIVNMASIAATFATPSAGAYSVTKAGVAMLSRQLAIELGQYGIRSNAINPGMILTGLSKSMYEQPGVEEARISVVPGGRIGKPSDIAKAALFLASDQAEYITGAEITVDGGFTQNLLSMVPRAGFHTPKGDGAS